MVVTVNYRSQVTAVVPQGFEPRLFWTKTRRVANYTIGQFAGPAPCSGLVLHPISSVFVAGARLELTILAYETKRMTNFHIPQYVITDNKVPDPCTTVGTFSLISYTSWSLSVICIPYGIRTRDLFREREVS